MAGKYSFQLRSTDKRRELPHKVIVGQHPTETEAQVLLKLFGYLLFYSPRLQLGPRRHDDDNPFQPDLLVVDYELRPTLWVECGDTSAERLDRLAVKVPEAELWVLRRSAAEAEDLLRRMAKAELRRERYRVVGLDAAMFEEVFGLMRSRNEIVWVSGTFEPPTLQFDFNGLWFDAPFEVWSF